MSHMYDTSIRVIDLVSRGYMTCDNECYKFLILFNNLYGKVFQRFLCDINKRMFFFFFFFFAVHEITCKLKI